MHSTSKGATLTGPCDAIQPRWLITTEIAFCHIQVLNLFLFRWTCHYSWTHINIQSQIQRCGSSYKSKKYINQNLIVATATQRQNIWFIDKFWKYRITPVARTLKENEKQFKLAGNSSYRRSTVTYFDIPHRKRAF